MRLEERDHSLRQLLEPSDAELLSITMIRGDLTTPEKLADLLEERYIPLVLHHAELWKDLPANFHCGLPVVPTKTQPSPSTKPTTHSGLRLSCWLSAPIGLSLTIEYRRIRQSFQHIAGCMRRHY